ncbi:hypothetical protein QJS10_CPB12g01635 [Acorus calamus]|uniref:CTLH domain-containing protein n=1 Tax=Acorus calamus TaxID=4465 RepID=A0AAV9DMM7_ACOCL|nr:hypothetical protein QJS10_CPB12g01635 [Acorus calamus]
MESTAVNWEALDSLVIDFAKSENLFVDSSSPPPSPSSSSSSPSLSSLSSVAASSYQSRLLIRQIRRSLESGDVDSAVDLLRLHAPVVLSDQHLLFRLQKQVFEAYEEFKHVLLALIYDKEDQASPVADERESESPARDGDHLPSSSPTPPPSPPPDPPASSAPSSTSQTTLESSALLISLLSELSNEFLIRFSTHHKASSYSEIIESALESLAKALLKLHIIFNNAGILVMYFLIIGDVMSGSSVGFAGEAVGDGLDPWSERRRHDIAGLISSVLRSQLQAYDPIFAMTLRYLISIHRGFCLRQGISSPISDLTERLLLEERDPPVTPYESLFEAPPFDEVDVQALAHAVEITRQRAVDSLRFAKGNLFEAFRNELCRMKLDVTVLDELIHEYCVYRGIVDATHVSVSDIPASSESSKVHAPDGSRDRSSLMDCGIGVLSDGETSVNNIDNVVMLENVNTSNVKSVDAELRVQRVATTARSRRKRWRGRVEELDAIPNASFSQKSKRSLGTLALYGNSNSLEKQQDIMHHSSVENIYGKDDLKYEIVLEIKELVSRGMAAEVVDRVEFLELVNTGDNSRALEVASSYLGPLAARNPDLLKPLKETLLALLRPDEDSFMKDIPLSVIATSLQVAMGGRLGIEEPQLMKLIRETLHTHNEWFKLQMCKDCFEGFLKIDSLKEIGVLTPTDPRSKSFADNSAHGSSQITTSSSIKIPENGSSPSHDSSRDAICDESAILKVMEFLALPRADAIHLLMQYNGNAENVIQQMFA